jgi:hypothetical protein
MEAPRRRQQADRDRQAAKDGEADLGRTPHETLFSVIDIVQDRGRDSASSEVGVSSDKFKVPCSLFQHAIRERGRGAGEIYKELTAS